MTTFGRREPATYQMAVRMPKSLRDDLDKIAKEKNLEFWEVLDLILECYYERFPK